MSINTDCLGVISLVFYTIILTTYLLSFKFEVFRVLKRNRIRDFPVLPLLVVLILWIAVLGCTWKRAGYMDITSISIASFVVELGWLYALSIYILKLYKFQKRRDNGILFLISACTIGLSLIISLSLFGLLPLNNSATQPKTVQQFQSFLRVVLYLDYSIHMALFIGLFSKYIKTNKILIGMTCVAVIVLIICACLFSVFPMYEFLQFFITLWLILTIFSAMVVTDYT